MMVLFFHFGSVIVILVVLGGRPGRCVDAPADLPFEETGKD
jgi:hypothetical protein